MAARTCLWSNKIGEETVIQSDEKMVCANCKVEMNFHAMKIDYTQTTNKAESVDHDFGGILEEFHSCPNCGMTATCEEKNAA